MNHRKTNPPLLDHSKASTQILANRKRRKVLPREILISIRPLYKIQRIFFLTTQLLSMTPIKFAEKYAHKI